MFFSILPLFSQTIWRVGDPNEFPDIAFDFGNINAAITASADGDTIVVYPIGYPHSYGGVNFAGKNVYITSLYKYTGDRSYIYNTILRGSNSAVAFTNNETRGAVLDGFTITGGRGEWINYPISTPEIRYGGGIYIRNASPTILNCIIEDNTATVGGGICVIATMSISPYFVGNIIKNNIATEQGGGIRLGNYQAGSVFDSINKNSIFLNVAPEHLDISSGFQSYLNVALDTFTVATADPYYINMSGSFDFSCEHWILEQTNQDIYVSVSGNDTNNGLSFDSPLKTIIEAMFRVRSNPDNRNTIHIAPGVYKASEGQIFPIKIKSDVILQGAGQDVTIIDLEQNYGAIHSFAGAKGFRVSGIAFRNNFDAYAAEYRRAPIVLNNTVDCEISDCFFENNVYGIQAYDINYYDALPEPLLLKNLSFQSNFNHVIDLSMLNAKLENIKILDNSYHNLGGGGYHLYGTPVRIDGNLSMRAEYTLSNILIASSQDYGVVYPLWDAYGASAIDIGNSVDALINNATIVGCFPVIGKEQYHPNDMMYIQQDSVVRIFNCIFWNNYSNHIYVFSGQGNSIVYIDNTLLEGGPSMVTGTGTLIWGEGNIDEYPGFDWGYLGILDWPYQLMGSSPCIDAGTLNIPNYTWLAGDLLGNTRLIGDTVDMGAYEFHGSSDFYVDFEGTPRTGEVPLTVQFTDTSIGINTTSWQWDFQNDGIIDSTEQNPSFTYYTTGQTTVRLVVNNGQGSRVKFEYINPRPAPITGGSLQGVVTSGGYPLSDVLVSVVGTTLNATTNGMGAYTIADIVAGTYSIRVEKVDYETYTHNNVVINIGETTTQHFVLSPLSESDNTIVPPETKLKGNYPNPFNPETTIAFSLATAGKVEVEIYNIKGSKVKTLVNEHRSVGNHQVIWDGKDDNDRNVGSGIYFYQMRANAFVTTKKMILMK